MIDAAPEEKARGITISTARSATNFAAPNLNAFVNLRLTMSDPVLDHGHGVIRQPFSGDGPGRTIRSEGLAPS